MTLFNRLKNNTMSIKLELLKSLKLKYEQEIQQNKATMLLYLNNPVGIGEHP